MMPDRQSVTSADRTLVRTVGAAHLALAGMVSGALAIALGRLALSGRLLAEAFAATPRYVSAERLLQIAPRIATLADEGALAVAVLLGVAAVTLVGAGRASWNAGFRRRWWVAAVCNLVNPLVAPLVVVGIVLTYLADASIAGPGAAGDGADTTERSDIDTD